MGAVQVSYKSLLVMLSLARIGFPQVSYKLLLYVSLARIVFPIVHRCARRPGITSDTVQVRGFGERSRRYGWISISRMVCLPERGPSTSHMRCFSEAGSSTSHMRSVWIGAGSSTSHMRCVWRVGALARSEAYSSSTPLVFMACKAQTSDSVKWDGGGGGAAISVVWEGGGGGGAALREASIGGGGGVALSGTSTLFIERVVAMSLAGTHSSTSQRRSIGSSSRSM
mmetsp:Transcript_66916/g.139471  ORF Transcript_66916/g.139471 Transcript_66916/m.139471 type:complete len:226 (-) Transcript_66916:674-1351(-)